MTGPGTPAARGEAPPTGSVDLHCHLLPGIDDGSADDAESLEFCRMAREDGIAITAATPHVREDTYPNTLEEIVASLDRFRALCEARGEPHRVVVGGEVFLRPDLLDLHRQGRLPTYGGHGRHFLLELPDFFPEDAVGNLVAGCVAEGLRPVIAHPERNMTFLRRPEVLHRLVVGGALAQVTALSLTGGFGREARRAGAWFVERRWVHVIASDAHNTYHRTPTLGSGFETARRLLGEEARDLVERVPRAIAEGRDVEVPSPGSPEPPRRGLLERLFG